MERSVGVRTTEFWMFARTGLAMLANGTALTAVPWDQFTIWMGATGLYGGLRTIEKTAALRAAKPKETGHGPE